MIMSRAVAPGSVLEVNKVCKRRKLEAKSGVGGRKKALLAIDDNGDEDVVSDSDVSSAFEE